jgi:cell division protein FtsB
MATQARRRTSLYETYGSVAYDPAWEGGAVAAPGGGEIVRPRPRVRPKERTLARPHVRVRQAGKVSPFAVVGFLCVGVLAVLLLMCCVRLTVLNDQSVQLRAQLAQLQEEESKLLTQYEMAYDLQAMEEQLTADGTMVKPSSSQMVVLDLSEPDNVVIYDQTEDTAGALKKAETFFEDLLP